MLAGVTVAVLVRSQNADNETLLADTVARADDVDDPPSRPAVPSCRRRPTPRRDPEELPLAADPPTGIADRVVGLVAVVDNVVAAASPAAKTAGISAGATVENTFSQR